MVTEFIRKYCEQVQTKTPAGMGEIIQNSFRGRQERDLKKKKEKKRDGTKQTPVLHMHSSLIQQCDVS